MIAELRRLAGEDAVLEGAPGPYAADATLETLGLRGAARATVRPRDADGVRRVVAWCYDHDVPIVPRGGGTGFAGGAVPMQDAVVLALERLDRVRELEPSRWRGHVDAGVSTATVARRARESGLLFAPNPGAAEQSQIGGNVATNAGGPRAFKYGVTRNWVTGLEAIVGPGELLRTGGAVRKDVSGYDLTGLLCGSEGTLGIVTSVWLRFVPLPERSAQVVAFYASVDAACAAIAAVFAGGAQPAALEYVDAGALAATAAAFPVAVPAGASFVVLAEADGRDAEVEAEMQELVEALGEGALLTHAATSRDDLVALARWRDGVSGAVTGVLGAKVSDDVAVPVDRLSELLDRASEIGARHGLRTCSWGHAGDGNVHVSFLLPPGPGPLRDAAVRASHDLHATAVQLGGVISGEHGIGLVKRGELGLQLGETGLAVHAAIKRALDPKDLFNPGKKR